MQSELPIRTHLAAFVQPQIHQTTADTPPESSLGAAVVMVCASPPTKQGALLRACDQQK